MNMKATWIKELENREQEIVRLRKEQIIREGEIYQREEKLKLDQALLSGNQAQQVEFLKQQKDLQRKHLDATLAEATEIGAMKGRAEERARSEALQKELDQLKTEEIDMLKDLLGKAITALQVNVKVERS